MVSSEKREERCHFGKSKIPIHQRKVENFVMKIEDAKKIRTKTRHLFMV